MLSCPECGASHPHFQFAGDTDMTTDGLASAGDREGGLLVLFQEKDSTAAIEGRDLRRAEFTRSVDRSPSAANLAFADFMKQYQPPMLIFSCAWCEVEGMTVGQEMTAAEFTREGGSIECFGAIKLDTEARS